MSRNQIERDIMLSRVQRVIECLVKKNNISMMQWNCKEFPPPLLGLIEERDRLVAERFCPALDISS